MQLLLKAGLNSLKRIGIITYHYGYNEGTLLQAYATQQLLSNVVADCEVEIIDWRYAPKERIVFDEPKSEREQALRDFFNDDLKKSQQCLSQQPIDDFFRSIRDQYDMLVVGSDELWRLDYQKRRKLGIVRFDQKNVWAPPFPNPYWPVDTSCPYISFASSISEQNDLRMVPRRHRNRMLRSLAGMSSISVRDSRTENFIRDLVPDSRQIHRIPDPTFGLSFDRGKHLAAFKQILDRHVDPTQRIALIVCHTDSAHLRDCISLCKSQGLCTVALTSSCDDVDVDLSQASIDPLTWASAFEAAELVITDRFHAAIFALQANRPVIALDYRAQKNGTVSKLRDLFDDGEIGDWYFDVKRRTAADSFAQMEECFKLNWPAASIQSRVNSLGDVLRQHLEQNVTPILTQD
ncbi:Polysaccharide pyruvyl transferase [Allorhodopirellula heiligendammensis]|uniref:Polysaccharide pyruvyl transferase n=2 Tax=Allorhodopirellula heiligendammensis TaxID=2714739 RepID=A0A5C6C5M2_9BACT|nr:Polysaccharide pyruvyl transferase [Allorhodopirellula heiligendammensis]